MQVQVKVNKIKPEDKVTKFEDIKAGEVFTGSLTGYVYDYLWIRGTSMYGSPQDTLTCLGRLDGHNDRAVTVGHVCEGVSRVVTNLEYKNNIEITVS
jgi:hypothetical protein